MKNKIIFTVALLLVLNLTFSVALAQGQSNQNRGQSKSQAQEDTNQISENSQRSSRFTPSFSGLTTFFEEVNIALSLTKKSKIKKTARVIEKRKKQLENLPDNASAVAKEKVEERILDLEDRFETYVEEIDDQETKEEILKEVEEEKQARIAEEEQENSESEEAFDINVSNLSVEYDSENNSVSLSWQNPSNDSFSNIRVLKRNSSEASSNDQLIYNGLAQEYSDNEISFEETYIYTVLVESGDGELSSGSIISISIPEQEIEEIEEVSEEQAEEIALEVLLTPSEEDVPAVQSAVVNKNPFENFPLASSVDPSVEAVSYSNFQFYHPGEEVKTFQSTGLFVEKEKDLLIVFDFGEQPDFLKTVGISISSQSDPDQIFSFLLKPKEVDSQYIAKIPPLESAGTYDVSIYLINDSDEVLKKLSGNLVITGLSLDTISFQNFSKFFQNLSLIFTPFFGR